jgi:UDP-glucuronate 4-epimerase
MRILLTGGAGFIGSHLAERMLASGYEVWALDNFDPYYHPKIKRENIKRALSSKRYRLLEGDIRNRLFLERVFKGTRFDKIIHLAAKAGVRSSLKDPISYADVNIYGTTCLLEACRKWGIGCFIFGSSSSVYGDCRIPYRETEGGLHPLSPYGVSKLAAEQICQVYHRLFGLRMTILRFFTVYGPRQRPDMAIHKFTRLIQNNRPIQVYGKGDSQRDYTYIDDITDGIMAVLKKRLDFEIINLGNSKRVKLKDLLSILQERLGKKAKLRYLPEEKAEPKATWASISKAGRLLKFRPRTGFEEGIDRFMDWHRNG